MPCCCVGGCVWVCDSCVAPWAAATLVCPACYAFVIRSPGSHTSILVHTRYPRTLQAALAAAEAEAGMPSRQAAEEAYWDDAGGWAGQNSMFWRS